MSYKYVLTEIKKNIFIITLNRPEKLNAFVENMREEILSALEFGCNDSDIKVIVITGKGKAFCVGGDVNEFISGNTHAFKNENPCEPLTMSKITLLINNVNKPVIAAVNGIAAGGGCNLALACDIRIISDTAKFGQVFVKRGVFPDWGGIYFLPRLVGYSKAAELLMTGKMIDANEALNIGIANQVVSNDDLFVRTLNIANEISKNAPIPIAFIKKGLQKYNVINLEEALEYERMAMELCWNSNDRVEGFKSFIEKRDPMFNGK